jgi:hypothetical protein
MDPCTTALVLFVMAYFLYARLHKCWNPKMLDADEEPIPDPNITHLERHVVTVASNDGGSCQAAVLPVDACAGEREPSQCRNGNEKEQQEQELTQLHAFTAGSEDLVRAIYCLALCFDSL